MEIITRTCWKRKWKGKEEIFLCATFFLQMIFSSGFPFKRNFTLAIDFLDSLIFFSFLSKCSRWLEHVPHLLPRTIEFDENYRLTRKSERNFSSSSLARRRRPRKHYNIARFILYWKIKHFAYIMGSCFFFVKRISRNKLRFNISSNFFPSSRPRSIIHHNSERKIFVLRIFHFLYIFHAFFKRNFLQKCLRV